MCLPVIFHNNENMFSYSAGIIKDSRITIFRGLNNNRIIGLKIKKYNGTFIIIIFLLFATFIIEKT